MSPGINDGPRNTGTLPKSNRRSDRNRERSAANQQIANRSPYPGHAQHTNNLLQLDWQTGNLAVNSERESVRTSKNSNTTPISSAPLTSHQDILDFALYNSGRQHNYITEDHIPRQKMVQPTDSRAQSPPRFQEAKPTNVDKMDRRIMESKLFQIRNCITSITAQIDYLTQLGDPNGDSGKEDMDENCDINRETELRKKIEEPQKKLAQLQEHQANLASMQQSIRERLNEARQAQHALLQQESQNSTLPIDWDGNHHLSTLLPTKVEQLESETALLRGKLAQLQTKKKHMDYLVAELQAVEVSDRASCSSDGSRNMIRDKAAELEAMKAQLAHLRAIMREVSRGRESFDSTSEIEPDMDANGQIADDIEINEQETSSNISNNLFDRQNDTHETNHGKMKNSVERPTTEDVQAVTRELKEQSALLQATRAELQHLKQQPGSAVNHAPTATIHSASTTPPSFGSTSIEKKQSNNVSGEMPPLQAKKRHLEDFMRKAQEQVQMSSISREMGGSELNSQRGSTFQINNISTPAHVWLPPNVTGSNEQNVDGISSSENLLDIGPQATVIDNGFSGNWWGHPSPPVNPLQNGSVEYYRQLLMGSQAQQLQMMGTTIQQCCQLLWAQQRELQSMRGAITQLQIQIRQSQVTQRINNIENQGEYSNLSRNVHHLGDTLDATLPPSSSLPNLVSLPNSSPALSHAPVVTSANPHQQQLNNQVPPGNRANNYWDNFRSYSRQNLLSGNAKTVAEATLNTVENSVSATNAASGGVNGSLLKDKRNREQGTDSLPLPTLTGTETQYSLNLQLQSNLQQQDRENTMIRSNIITNEVSQLQVENNWEEAQSSFPLTAATNDVYQLHQLSPEMKEVLSSLVVANKRRPDYLIVILREIKTISEDHRLRPHLLRVLRALQDTQTILNNPLNDTTDQTASESCQSSDEDSDVGAFLGFNTQNQSLTDVLTQTVSTQAGTLPSGTARTLLIDHLELPVICTLDTVNSLPSTSTMKPGCNEDLAEADQSRPESTANQEVVQDENNQDRQENMEIPLMITRHEIEMELESLAAKAEDERAEDGLD